MYTEIDSRYGKWFNPLISYIIQYTPLVIQIEIFISSDSTYIRDSGIRILANELSEIFNQRIWLFRSEFQCTDTQIKYKFYQTETFIVLQTLLFTFFNLCLHFSILVHTFLLFSISTRSCRDNTSFAYSCFIPESLIYWHWLYLNRKSWAF